MSVLAAGEGGVIDMDDLGLKKGYSLYNAALTATTYNDLMIEVRPVVLRYETRILIALAPSHSQPGNLTLPLRIYIQAWSARRS